MVQVQAEGGAGAQQGWSESDLWSAQGSHLQAVGLGTTTSTFMPDAADVAATKAAYILVMSSLAPSMPSFCSRRVHQAADRGWQVYPHACDVAQAWYDCLAFRCWSLLSIDRMFPHGDAAVTDSH